MAYDTCISIMIGRLARPPIQRVVGRNKDIDLVDFCIAVSHTNEKTSFFNFKTYNKIAINFLLNHVQIGDLVSVESTPEQYQYTCNCSKVNDNVNFIAYKVNLLAKSNKNK